MLDVFWGDKCFYWVKKENLVEMGVGKMVVIYGLCGFVGKCFVIFIRKKVLIR